MSVADAIAQAPGRALLTVLALVVALPVWIRESRLDRKWRQ